MTQLMLRIESDDGDRRNDRRVPLVRRLTTVGRGPDNACVLADPEVPDCAFHLEARDGAFILRAEGDASVAINGKKRTTAILAPGDRIEIGKSRLHFEETRRKPAPQTPIADESPESAALECLIQLSQKLSGKYQLSDLLESVIDQVIALTGAEKGFLILLEGSERSIRVARNRKHQNLLESDEAVSDSIIETVVTTGRPSLVSDALNDDEFRHSESVVNLRLLSVMCAPLMERGELFGLIYVGSDRVANLFDPWALALLETFAGIASLIVRNALLVDELKFDNADLRRQLEERRFGEVIGTCTGMQEVFRTIDKVATTDISVLITGETGTGKELIARELHRRSSRANGPFVAINCGAIPEALLESELFGHVRGAFTGAVGNRDGHFHAANGGTLFLDEIGELPLPLQVKLLRVLQEKQVTRIGQNKSEPLDIRIVSATHRILENDIRQGRFREDLYYRINVIALQLLPLRERGNDLITLAQYFLDRNAREFHRKTRGFTPGALSAMRRYPWPGNIRELENRVKKGVLMADQAIVTAANLGLSDSEGLVVPLAQAKEAFQKRYIDEILERNGGNRAKTARDLGVDPRTIFRHLEQDLPEGGRAEDPPEEDGP